MKFTSVVLLTTAILAISAITCVSSSSSDSSDSSSSSSSSDSSDSSSSSSSRKYKEDFGINSCANEEAFTVLYQGFFHYNQIVKDNNGVAAFLVTKDEINAQKDIVKKIKKIKKNKKKQTLVLRFSKPDLSKVEKLKIVKINKVVKKLVKDFKKTTGMKLKYVMLPAGAKEKVVKAFFRYNVVVISEAGKISHSNDIDASSYEGIIVAESKNLEEKGLKDLKEALQETSNALSLSACIEGVISTTAENESGVYTENTNYYAKFVADNLIAKPLVTIKYESNPQLRLLDYGINACSDPKRFTLLFMGMSNYQIFKNGYHPDAAIIMTKSELMEFYDRKEVNLDPEKVVLLVQNEDIQSFDPSVNEKVAEFLNLTRGLVNFNYFIFADNSRVSQEVRRAFAENNVKEIYGARPWIPEVNRVPKGFVVVDLQMQGSKVMRDLDAVLDRKEWTPLSFGNCVARLDSVRIRGNLTKTQKRALFYGELRNTYNRNRFDELRITIDRASIFDQSYNQLNYVSNEDLKRKILFVKFNGEIGADAGGLTKDWFVSLAKVVFDPNYGIFKASETNQNAFTPFEGESENQLNHLRFIGRIIGKGVIEKILLPCHFTKSFYKLILGKKPNLNDLTEFDAVLHQSLCWIADNDVTNVLTDTTTFTVDVENFGVHKSIELKEGGAEIALTEENKFEYIRLMTEYKLEKVIQPQIDAFLDGFYQMVPVHLLSNFTVSEFNRLLSGVIEIDVDDWEDNTNYSGYNRESPQIIWFWQAVRSFTEAEKRSLLKFVTGSPSVPLEGFRNLTVRGKVRLFEVQRIIVRTDNLPISHTCFNRIDLPEYDNYDDLRKKLLLASLEGSGAFELL